MLGFADLKVLRSKTKPKNKNIFIFSSGRNGGKFCEKFHHVLFIFWWIFSWTIEGVAGCVKAIQVTRVQLAAILCFLVLGD